MTRNRSSSLRRAAVAVLALCSIPSAHAQFSDKTSTIPMLIQDGFGPAGDMFPFGGQFYCTPTAASMSLLYLGANGFNQIGPANPDSADGLNLVRILSGFMSTGALTGTTTTKYISAIDTYLNAKGIGSANFTLSTYSNPTIAQLATINQPGTVVDLSSTYYVPSGNTYVATGGHCVALLSQGVNAQGQPAPNTLVIDNPLPGALGPPSDVSGNSLEYLNTSATTGVLTADGNVQYDINQFPGYWGTARDVLTTAIALTVNPTQQSANNPAIATWNISTIQQLGPSGGNFSVLAPIIGTGGLTQGTWGTVELENTDDATGTNTVIAGTLRSDIAAGRPFGTGSINLQAAALDLVPTSGSAAVTLAVADASGNRLTFSAGCTLALNRNGNNSLAFQFGGNNDGATANLSRSGTGTLVIVPASGNANLGTSEQLIINGTAANLPTLTNGIVPPYIVSQDNDGDSSADFLTYGAAGFTRTTYVQDSTTPITSTTSTTIYHVQTAQSVPTNTTASVYALNVGPTTITGGSSSVLNIGPQSAGQAGLILNGGSINTTNLNFGSAEAVIYTSAANGTINSIIQGTGGLTTFGPGALTLKGNNTFTGTTNINSGTLIAANTTGSATGAGAVVIQQNGALKVTGASAKAGSAAGTTINFGGTLFLNGGTINGPLTANFGSYLFGQGTVNGAASVFGNIGSSATDLGSAPYTGVENILFTGSLATGINTIYDWRLNALDATPANAGTNWSLLKFTGSPITLGTSSSPFNITLDLGSNVPDPNSGNPFWNAPHQWDAVNSVNGFSSVWYNRDFPTYSAGYFSVTVDPAFQNLYINFTPTSNTWNLNANGNWTAPANWTGYVPNSVNATATFAPTISTPRTITVDAPQTVGILNFTSPITYTIAGTYPITLSSSSDQAQINVTAGTHSISAPLSFASNTTITTSPAASLTLSGPLTISPATALTLSGAGAVTFTTDAGSSIASPLSIVAAGGTLTFASTEHLASLSVAAAATVTASIASPRNVIVTGSLTNSGLINLTDNDLIVHNGILNTISNEITQGHGAGGTWWTAAAGITSSSAAVSPATTALGIELNDNGLGGTLMSTFDNQPVASTDILIKYTFVGDADLSGTITAADYTLIDNGFNNDLSGWRNGDFNYDGFINGDDYTLIDNAFNTQGSITFSAVPTAQIAQVPEPLIPLTGYVAFALMKRRRALNPRR